MSREDVVAKACLVMPMYNEGTVIAGVVGDALLRFGKVICVDDGSTDESAATARLAGAMVVQHPINLGQGAAIETGIRQALRDPDVAYVVTFDADGQHDVADAANMVRKARECDIQVVLGSRFLQSCETMPAARRVLLRAAVLFSRTTTGLHLTDAHNGLRVLRRDAAARLTIRMHGMSHASEILGQVAREQWSYVEYPTTVRYTEYSRGKGQRGYNALNIAFDLAVSRVRRAA